MMMISYFENETWIYILHCKDSITEVCSEARLVKENVISAGESCSAAERIGTEVVGAWQSATTDLSKAIHPTMITDADDPLIHNLRIRRGACGVMDNYGRPPTLNYMNGNPVGATQGEDFGFTTPDACITYGDTVPLELLRAHQASIESARTILPTGRW
jgi:hypothetical protein